MKLTRIQTRRISGFRNDRITVVLNTEEEIIQIQEWLKLGYSKTEIITLVQEKLFLSLSKHVLRAIEDNKGSYKDLLVESSKDKRKDILTIGTLILKGRLLEALQAKKKRKVNSSLNEAKEFTLQVINDRRILFNEYDIIRTVPQWIKMMLMDTLESKREGSSIVVFI
jgi:hypothetical protein